MPTKVAETNCSVLRQSGEAAFHGRTENRAGDVDVEPVEKHADADQQHNAPMEWPDREPVEPRPRRSLWLAWRFPFVCFVSL